MSQIPTQNDNNRPVAASDFDQPNEMPGQQETHQQQFGLTEGTRNFIQALKTELMNEIKMLAEQQKLMMAQFQAQFNSLEQKLMKEAEQRVQMGKNELEGIIQQKMEKFRMNGMGQQEIGSNSNKAMILANPKGIVWNRLKTEASISNCGLKVISTGFQWVFPIATDGFAISGRPKDNFHFQFPVATVYYYEVTMDDYLYTVGFTDGSKPAYSVGRTPNSYGITGYDCGFGANKRGLWLSGKMHKLECPTGFSSAGAEAEVIGAGLLMNSQNELAVFFTRNGNLLVNQTPIKINPAVDRLYPAVSIRASVEANFGDDLVANPFKYDIVNCPGLFFE